MRQSSLKSFIYAIVFCVSSSPPVAFAEEREKPSAEQDIATCELIFDSAQIKNVVLTDLHGGTVAYRLQGSSMFLPPGRYWIESIELQNGYTAFPTIINRPDNQLELTPDKPYRLSFDKPLTPTVTAKRTGRLLVLDCVIGSENGWKYRPSDRNNPPQFAVYQGDQQIGSGTFEYG
jgi:hypothetical protein